MRGIGALFGSAMLVAWSASTGAGQPPPSTDWIAVPKATLNGTGIPVDESAGDGLPSSYFTELQPATHLKFGLIHSDRIQTAVVETAGEITRSVDFPGDEVVQMRSGETILIDDLSGEVHIARAGDYFIVPAHWRGLWIFHSDQAGPAREHAMVSPPDYAPTKPLLDKAALPKDAPVVTVLTQVDIAALRSRLKPMDLTAPLASYAGTAQKGYIIFAGEPSFYLLASSEPVTFTRPATVCDSVVRVISGTLTLKDNNGRHATFGAEDVVVIKQQFKGIVTTDSQFLGLSVTSSGAGTPVWPAKAESTTHTCAAL